MIQLYNKKTGDLLALSTIKQKLGVGNTERVLLDLGFYDTIPKLSGKAKLLFKPVKNN